MCALLRKKARLLVFGVLATFFSSPGQVFLISFFIPPMRDELGLSQTVVSGLFFVSTLTSSFLLPFLGRRLDRERPVRFVMVTGILLMLGCWTLGAARAAWMLLAGFFLVRNFGQGGLAMASQTMMARLEGEYRGKALGIANLGYPLSEALLPGFVSTMITVFGWRAGWYTIAAMLLVIFLPLVPYLIRHEPRPSKRHPGAPEDLSVPDPEDRSWTVSSVMKDRRFHLLILPILVTPAFLTALFFHHAAIIGWKRWDPILLPAGFVVYAVFRALVSFFSGPLTDRFSARRIFTWNLVPLTLGVLVLWAASGPFWIFVYFAGSGITMGYGMTVGNALYAELYGTRHLGSIRGMVTTLIVFSTAIAPFVMGMCLDAGVSLSFILRCMVLVSGLGVYCTHLALKPVRA
ncbi:MAG TPA: MFS transporter [Candidatus Omnitrophota bacterium]|nr:MFS transporter [Candidatus Omnitrophota bacterium]